MTQSQLEAVLLWLVPGSMFLGLLSLCLVIASALGNTLFQNTGMLQKVPNIVAIIFYSGAVLCLASISMVSDTQTTVVMKVLLRYVELIYNSIN